MILPSWLDDLGRTGRVAAENEASAAESNARYFYWFLVNFCLTNWMPRVIYGYARSARRLPHPLLPEVQAVHAVELAPTISREPALRVYFCRGAAPLRPLFEFAYVRAQFIAPFLRFDFLERAG